MVVWPPFVRAAAGLALVGGFGLGGALGSSLALGVPLGGWWVAAIQAHGHVQLIGWAGLMVLGVGFHFMPRLRGAPLWRPQLTRVVLFAIGAGLVLRLVGQPLGMGAALAASGLLELSGGVLAIALLVGTMFHGPPLAQRAGLRPVLPFFALGFACLLGALTANAVGAALAGTADETLVGGWLDGVVVAVALEGFLVPVALGMSMRLFPLYFRTQLPNLPLARLGLLLWGVGLAARLTGSQAGALVQATAVGLLVTSLGIFGARTPRPREPLRIFAPIHLHALSAYGWLIVGVLAQAVGAADPARHALGAGFITLLIFGVGEEMLPGFARRPLRDRRLSWLTLVFGNTAAVARVAPGLLALPSAAAGTLYAVAGLCGLAAVAAFAAAVPTSPRNQQ